MEAAAPDQVGRSNLLYVDDYHKHHFVGSDYTAVCIDYLCIYIYMYHVDTENCCRFFFQRRIQ